MQGFFILALAGCSIKKEDTKKIQDIEFTVVAPEDVPEELKEDIEKARDTPFRLTYADQGGIFTWREGYGEKEKNGVQCRGQRMLRNIRCCQDPDNTSRSGKGREDKRKEDISVCGDENRI